MVAPFHFAVDHPVKKDASTEHASAGPLPPIDDHFKWAYEQAAYLRQGRFDLVDVENVADEIESVAKSELRSMRSNVEIILIHLLKWHHQPNRRSRSWVNSIDEHRARVSIDLSENPSMVSAWQDTVEKAYRVARLRAAREAELDARDIAEICPFDREQIMDAPYTLDRD